jgi:hypothetical protein
MHSLLAAMLTHTLANVYSGYILCCWIDVLRSNDPINVLVKMLKLKIIKPNILLSGKLLLALASTVNLGFGPRGNHNPRFSV